MHIKFLYKLQNEDIITYPHVRILGTP